MTPLPIDENRHIKGVSRQNGKILWNQYKLFLENDGYDAGSCQQLPKMRIWDWENNILHLQLCDTSL